MRKPLRRERQRLRRARREVVWARDQLLPARLPDLSQFYDLNISNTKYSISLKVGLNPGPVVFPQRFFLFELIADILGVFYVLLFVTVNVNQGCQHLQISCEINLTLRFLWLFMSFVPLILAVLVNLRVVIVGIWEGFLDGILVWEVF